MFLWHKDFDHLSSADCAAARTASMKNINARPSNSQCYG